MATAIAARCALYRDTARAPLYPKCLTSRRRSAAAAAAAGPSDVFVLDFDGVICDSQGEVNRAGLQAAADYWPDVFAGLDAERAAQLEAGLRATRPRLIKGYESMVMARLIQEDPSGAVDRILEGWDEAMLATALRGWGEDASGAGPAAAFDAHRTAAQGRDARAWLAENPMYEGVPEALAECPFPFYVASSKGAGRLLALLNGPALDLKLGDRSPRVFAGLLPPSERKIEVLRDVMERPLAAGAALHFVDDRFETLEAISSEPDLVQRWRLYHAGWGYCTREERAAAAALPGVQPLSLRSFCELLRWGLVSGVDDGCEPTPEEVEAGVYIPRPVPED